MDQSRHQIRIASTLATSHPIHFSGDLLTQYSFQALTSSVHDGSGDVDRMDKRHDILPPPRPTRLVSCRDQIHPIFH